MKAGRKEEIVRELWVLQERIRIMKELVQYERDFDFVVLLHKRIRDCNREISMLRIELYMLGDLNKEQENGEVEIRNS